MSHHNMIYENGKRMREFLAFLFLLKSSFLYFGVFLIISIIIVIVVHIDRL